MPRPFVPFLLAVLLCTVSVPRAAHATSITVTTTADELNADGDCSLREAIQAANSNAAIDACAAGQGNVVDTIVVAAGTYTLALAGGADDDNSGGDLDVRDDVTITGAGAATTIIQACDADQRTTACPAGHGLVDRVMHVIDSYATMTGVTIRHGRKMNDVAGGVLVHKATSGQTAGLTLTDAVVTRNATDSTLTVSSYGGGIAAFNATLVLTRVTVSDNAANGSLGSGGGIANVSAESSLTMTDCTVSGNLAHNLAGGIYNDSDATAVITSTTISGNRADLGNGGALVNRLGADAVLTNCTVSGNESGGSFGGGIFNGGGCTLDLRSCTITGNHLGTGQGAGGIDASGTITLRNTIVAGNTHANTTPSLHSPDCDSQSGADRIVSEGHNLVGEALHCPALIDGANGDQIGTQEQPLDPGLAALADNGGPTLTHALLENSLALDAGDPATPGSGGTACPATDQRGETRPSGIGCDTGAVELAVTSTVAVGSVRPAVGGNAGTTYTRVFGSGFAAGAVVRLVRPGFSDVVGTTTSVRASQITATLDLTGVAVGVWSVRVVNPDASTATLADAYTVEGGGGSDLWSALILPRAFVEGRSQTIYVQFGNRGLNDARAVPLWLSFPDELEFHVQFPVSAPPVQPGQIATDWTRIGVDVPIPPPASRDSFPLLLPVVPAGATMTLRVRVTSPLEADPSRLPFRVSADVGAPYFQPEPSAAIVAGYVARAKEYATAAHGTTTFPSDAVIEQYVRTQLAKVVSEGTSATLANLGGDPIVYSQAQLLIDTGQFLAGESATASASRDLRWLVRLFSVAEAEARLVNPDCDPADAYCEHEISTCEDDPHLCKDPPLIQCDQLNQIDGNYIFVPCNPEDNDDRPLRDSADPNDKIGPAALEDFIDGVTPMPYAILFENKPQATGDAYEVTITDQLDTTKFDLATFRLGPIMFGSTLVPVPPDAQSFSTEVDLRPGRNILVGIDAALDTNTGVVTWRFTTLDPATHEFPEDPEDGFLPPNVTQPQGEGSVLFTVNLKPGVAVDTAVCNRARIVFDFNDPIDTPDYCNTVGEPGGPVQPETPESCGNCVDDDGDGLSDFEDPDCCAAGGPSLTLKRGMMKPAKTQSRLALNGTLAGTLPDATTSGLAVQIRLADGGELLCARIPAGSFRKKGKKAVTFVDKKGTLAGAGGLAKIVLKTKKNGTAALAVAGKRAAFATPPAGPVSITVGFGDGTSAGQCAAATATFRAKKKGTIVAP